MQTPRYPRQKFQKRIHNKENDLYGHPRHFRRPKTKQKKSKNKKKNSKIITAEKSVRALCFKARFQPPSEIKKRALWRCEIWTGWPFWQRLKINHLLKVFAAAEDASWINARLYADFMCVCVCVCALFWLALVLRKTLKKDAEKKCCQIRMFRGVNARE